MEAAQYDLIVVGAGPAGSACAITAARAGAKVLLLEKDHFPRQKVCGEFVSPESLGLLHGFLEDGRFQSCPQVVSSRIFLDNKTLALPVSPRSAKHSAFRSGSRAFCRCAECGRNSARRRCRSAKCSVMKYFTCARRKALMLRAPSSMPPDDGQSSRNLMLPEKTSGSV